MILARVNDYQMKDSHRKFLLCTNANKLSALVKIPIYDSELEINAFYSILLSIIRRSLFVIRCIENKIISPEEELEPQEIKELTSQKQAELESLKQLLGIICRFIKIHPSISVALCDDMYANLFQKLLTEADLIVSLNLTKENKGSGNV